MSPQARGIGLASRRAAAVSALLVSAGLSGCFGASSQQRSYFTMHGQTDTPGTGRGPIPGLVRVRDLDVDSAYDKFQIVVRHSPYELRYSEANVWAVKPARMLSDMLGVALQDGRVFGAVSRELRDSRPRYVLDGDIQAIELYDSGDDLWFAHIAFSLRLTRFGTGEVLWRFAFDERKEVTTRTFGHGVRALSELYTRALSTALASMAPLRPTVGPVLTPEPPPVGTATSSAAAESAAPPTPPDEDTAPDTDRERGPRAAPPRYDPKAPIFVPEGRGDPDAGSTPRSRRDPRRRLDDEGPGDEE